MIAKEIKELNELMSGIADPKLIGGWSSFGNSSTNKQRNNEFTWNDVEFNLNSFPNEVDTAIIVTSWCGHLPWLKPSLISHRKTGYYVILAYDNSSYIWDNIEDPDYDIRMFPRPVHFHLAHSFIMKHKTYDADKRTGWFWNVKYANSIIKGFPNIKYVYCTNGDCIIEKPEGFTELKTILGDGDFMSGQSSPNGTIHTADIFFRRETFDKIINYMENRMRYPIWASQSPEALLRDAVDELKLKETFAKQPLLPYGSIDYYCTQNLESTWKKVLGFRNLYAEMEYRENNGLEPLPKEYFDDYRNWFYMREGWKETICKYYDTKDRRYLMQYWDRGKDSSEDRKFLPLEHYGVSPIYA
jgi:hypothetical protein